MAALTSPRPNRQTQRLAAILAAAEEVFLEKGFEGGSLDDVARQANASKATIYAHFGNKLGLFRALLEHRIGQIRAPLHAGEAKHEPVRDVLTEFGRGFLHTLLSPVPLKFYRLMVSQGSNFPDLAKLWFAEGPRTNISMLAAFLKHRAELGEMDIAAPDTVAELFLMSLRGALHLQAAAGLIHPPFDKAITAKVAAAVDMMMRAYGPKGAKS
ncbi:MAG: TetR/AcrR family transcriptional regulator [Rhodospirillaceae bacterium]|nr:TetR/AcrR family transcriptional regulator [Rhodospirillaceae bacterium]